MGSFIYKAYINYPYFINFADADATTGSRPEIIYWYGKAINDPVMYKFGSFLAKQQDWGNKPFSGKVDEQLFQLISLKEIQNAPVENALVSDFWLPQTEVAGARDRAGASEGFFFAAKGGHNNESHNHNDLGTCVLYFNGKPCLIDIGRETYVAKTFSSSRYEIWTMQSGFHNLPKINGEDQMQGQEFVAKNTTFSADTLKAVFSTDISGAYTKKAAVNKWTRSYRLDRGKKFTISDDFELSQITGNRTSLNFVTSCKVTETGPGYMNLEGDDFILEMKYNSEEVSTQVEFYDVTDNKLKHYWPEGITRIVIEFKKPGLTGQNQLVISEVK